MNKIALRALLCALPMAVSGLPAHSAWNNLAAMPQPQQDAAVETIDGIVYVVGGFQGSNLATLQAYDPTQNQWTTLSDMPGPRYSGNGAGVINSQLYVAGGWTQNPPLPNDTLFLYDPPTDTWSNLASMPHLSACGASGVIDGKLYVTTACNGYSGYTNFLDVYDPSADAWTSLSGSATPHSQPAAGVINGKLYVAGGLQADGSVGNGLEVYDPAGDHWTTRAPMPHGVTNSASAVLSGRLYVFGGQLQSHRVSNQVQIYDPHKNTWTAIPMPTARSGASATVTYGIAFVAGGVGSGGTVLTSTQDLIVTPSIP
ncbi:MAG TPA: kelch repeat-containing protein [Thermoanaerobaculia bacterium]|nr:kelch repeat-containing protein [Thermoanaerobaculia bacterium]